MAPIEDGSSGAEVSNGFDELPEPIARECQEANIRSDKTQEPAQREEAVALVKCGQSQTEVARILGISLYTISQWCRTAGVAGKAQKARRREEAASLIKSAKSRSEVAEQFGVTLQTVSAWCKKAGPPASVDKPRHPHGQKGTADFEEGCFGLKSIGPLLWSRAACHIQRSLSSLVKKRQPSKTGARRPESGKERSTGTREPHERKVPWRSSEAACHELRPAASSM
ncbi:helix-turn-helix domain-containing protein [Fodinicurvata sp. EGI_FJ10296]|uniref:helix-turn-helix domain-containing protein n=1 Tax=Fodinicurvata sp. EGI_FJ10296 TaxID=3231908 RepID=UPI00345660D9